MKCDEVKSVETDSEFRSGNYEWTRIRQRGIALIIALAGENSLTAASLSGSSN